jgi:excinuclease ABC subunit B
MKFELVSPFQPTGDQPEAIQQLTQGVLSGEPYQVLLGVTGSGKTFTIANVIQNVQKPTLILSHNKTLAAQLYAEFKHFFPNNLVEFFISYYDYYQPEAYIPVTNTYIEKDLAINSEIERLRIRATSALMSGRKDVIIVSSVSCIYGMGRPEDYEKSVLRIHKNQKIDRNFFLLQLVSIMYSRNDKDFPRSTFRVRGDSVDIHLAYMDNLGLKVRFFGNEIEDIYTFDVLNGNKIEKFDEFDIYPANLFVTSRETLEAAIRDIQDELTQQIAYFEKQERWIEAQRIKERTELDIEMMREIGYCKGIENYSRHLTRRKPGERPYCLLDYFPEDFLLVIDESHVSVPQIRAMYGGDRSRKIVLVENGFRLPSALDNRPLSFEEFEHIAPQTIFVSATPGDYEIDKANGVIVEQIIRPTGLLDPPVEVRPLWNQVDDLIHEIHDTVERGNRVLVTTLTKRLSEELARYFAELQIRARYIHSELDALERVELLQKFRDGDFDVLVGINLLREGLDLPEVELVAILDADKEGFLRSTRSFIQIAGRAARSIYGRVILYADKITESMQKLIDETERRRNKQIEYNLKHNIIPKTAVRSKEHVLSRAFQDNPFAHKEEIIQKVAEEAVKFLSKEQLLKAIEHAKKQMLEAAEKEEYLLAAAFRDEMFALQKRLNEMSAV